MPPPGRKSLNHKARVDDSDSEGDDGRLPKYEQIQPQYLNQPIDHKLGESKLKALILDLGNLSKYLKQSASTLYEVAGDVSESLSRPEDEEPDYDDLPEDPVSSRRSLDCRTPGAKLTRLFALCLRRMRSSSSTRSTAPYWTRYKKSRFVSKS